MRLSDAITELDGIEGARTHRSWWVAKAYVREARRAEGRAILVLPSGAQAPVSRTYLSALRSEGWF
jgi:DNA-binding LytR/AlgR family response regulator